MINHHKFWYFKDNNVPMVFISSISMLNWQVSNDVHKMIQTKPCLYFFAFLSSARMPLSFFPDRRNFLVDIWLFTLNLFIFPFYEEPWVFGVLLTGSCLYLLALLFLFVFNLIYFSLFYPLKMSIVLHVLKIKSIDRSQTENINTDMLQFGCW